MRSENNTAQETYNVINNPYSGASLERITERENAILNGRHYEAYGYDDDVDDAEDKYWVFTAQGIGVGCSAHFGFSVST